MSFLPLLPPPPSAVRRPYQGVLLAVAAYALVMTPLFLGVRHGVVFNLALLPCLVTVWRYGLIPGLLTWAGVIGVNRLLVLGFMEAGRSSNPKVAIFAGLFQVCVVMLAAWLRHLLLQLREEMVQREEVEASLRAHRDELHRLVEVRTQELEAAHQRLSHTEKMRSLGVLAGSLAHDFNNMLTTIHGFSELMLLKRPGTEGCPEYARQVQQASLRARDLTRQLLTFSRETPPANHPVSVHTLVNEVAGILRHTLGRSITLVVELQARRSTVMGDESQLQSALFNLALNARDAMPEGGQLLLATRVLEREGVPHLALEVRDTGSGVPEDIQTRIFEPFFTTKGLGKGTGLGLAAVLGIVRRHGGTVELESHPGHGAAFTLFLPLTDAEVSPLKATRAGQAVPICLPTTLRVLLLGESMLLMGLLQEMFKTLGCSTRLARSWQEGRGLLEGVDLVLMDLDLPDAGAEVLVSHLQGLETPPPVALLLGGPACCRVEALVAQGVRILEKPFEIKDLAGLLEACHLAEPGIAAGPVIPPLQGLAR